MDSFWGRGLSFQRWIRHPRRVLTVVCAEKDANTFGHCSRGSDLVAKGQGVVSLHVWCLCLCMNICFSASLSETRRVAASAGTSSCAVCPAGSYTNATGGFCSLKCFDWKVDTNTRKPSSFIYFTILRNILTVFFVFLGENYYFCIRGLLFQYSNNNFIV